MLTLLSILLYVFEEQLTLDQQRQIAGAAVGFAFLALIIIAVVYEVRKQRRLKAIERRKEEENKKKRERHGFSEDVKSSVLRKQDHRCAKCNRLLNVVDFHHKDGDRSNNSESNCEALCPTCHADISRR